MRVLRASGIGRDMLTGSQLMLGKGWEHYFPRYTLTRKAVRAKGTNEVMPLREDDVIDDGVVTRLIGEGESVPDGWVSAGPGRIKKEGTWELIPEKDLVKYPSLGKQETYVTQLKGIENKRVYLHPMDQLGMHIRMELMGVADSQAAAILTPHKFIPKLQSLYAKVEGMTGRLADADDGIVNITQKELDSIRKSDPGIADILERRTEDAIEEALETIDKQLENLMVIPREYSGTSPSILASIQSPGTAKEGARAARDVAKLQRELRKAQKKKLEITVDEMDSMFRASNPSLKQIYKAIDVSFKELEKVVGGSPRQIKAALKQLVENRPKQNREYLKFLSPEEQKQIFLQRYRDDVIPDAPKPPSGDVSLEGMYDEWGEFAERGQADKAAKDFDTWAKANEGKVIDLDNLRVVTEGVEGFPLKPRKPMRGTEPPITIKELNQALRSVAGETKDITGSVEGLVKNLFKGGTKEQRDTFAELLRKQRKTREGIVTAKENELAVAKKRSSAWKEAYKDLLKTEEGVRKRQIDNVINKGKFSGYFFPKHIADEMNQFYGEKANVWAKRMQDLAAAPRTMTTGFDVGVGFIHLLPLLTKNPAAWAKAMKYQYVGVFGDPDAYIRYVNNPQNQQYTDELATWGLDVNMPASEMVESMGKGGIVHKAASKVRGGKAVVTRFEKGFNGALGVGQLEQYKALRRLAFNPDGTLIINPKTGAPTMIELVRYIGKSTGVISSRRMGVGATQRAAESGFAFFAPRYFRAGMALWADLVKGGIEGDQARKTLAQLGAGAMATYTGACLATGQEIHLNPKDPKFMVLQVGNSNVGVGSFHIAMIKTIATTMGAPSDDNKSLLELNSKDNPLVRFLRSKASIPTGAVWDIMDGSTFLGEPLDSFEDIAREEVLGRSTPFWLSNFITEDPSPTADSLPWATHGFRTWAIQWSQKRDELREKYAQKDYPGTPYAELDKLQVKQLNEKYESLATATTRAENQYKERATGDRAVLNDYMDMRDYIKKYRSGRLEGAAEAVVNNVISHSDFRKVIQDVGDEVSGMYQMMEEDPRYKDIDRIFRDVKKETDPEILLNVAYDQYVSVMFSNDFTDAYGMFDYDSYQKEVTRFKGLFGEQMYNKVQEIMHFDDKLPDLALEYQRVQKLLEPYWEIENYYINSRGDAATIRALKDQWSILEQQMIKQGLRAEDISRIKNTNFRMLNDVNRQISSLRDGFKQQRPDIAMALRLWYT